jgi:hypothetical protein
MTFTLRHVPWTCEWGRFGVAIDGLALGCSHVDDVFWACHHPTRSPNLRLTKRAECESCPYWQEARGTTRERLASLPA